MVLEELLAKVEEREVRGCSERSSTDAVSISPHTHEKFDHHSHSKEGCGPQS
jgi:hypothetical protein